MGALRTHKASHAQADAYASPATACHTLSRHWFRGKPPCITCRSSRTGVALACRVTVFTQQSKALDSAILRFLSMDLY